MALLSAALARLVGRPPAPTDAPPSSARVPLRFRRKYCEDGGSVFNAGEIAGYPASQATRLVAEGYAVRVGPNAQPSVSPRPDSTEEYRLATLPPGHPDIWSPSSASDLDGNVTLFRGPWPPR